MGSLSIYFFAGDFVDVLERFQRGEQQIYQTHNECARLIHELLAANYRVNIYSFVTTERREDRPIDGLRIISLGASDYSAKSLLAAAIEKDDSSAVLAHFPNLELLRAVAATNKRAMAILASSYNGRGLRSIIARRRLVSLLNIPRFELVSNHCLPATEHLAKIGVTREKLIPYDTPHPFDPKMSEPKQLLSDKRFEVVYAGSIVEGKGVSDLVCAIALLRKQQIEVHCSFAGSGNIEAIQALGKEHNVSDLLTFLGRIGNDDVFKMMVAADLVAVPSRTLYPEGFPLTMFEAIASRTPIVCSDHPMFRPVMVDGQNASIFPSGDHRALATAMRRTLTDPALYNRLSNNALLTWEALKGPADWRTLIVKWAVEGSSSPWIRDHMLMAVRQQKHA